MYCFSSHFISNFYYQIPSKTPKILQKNCKNISRYHRSSFQDNFCKLFALHKSAGNVINVKNLNIYKGPKGSSNTLKTCKNVSRYFKRRHLMIYKYFSHCQMRN